ncbi:phage tail protein [Enterobacter sp.]|uniref:phage tail protein n=1 Tax=Enterobacter sp. TaxID=42895 RepID=UPI00296E4220|nr:phage tail protein [Enterobacter sp.]
MTAKYFAILTNQGAARLANASALGTKLNLTQMAVGDASGTLPVPDPAQTKLINQKRIAQLNMLSIDPNNTSQIIAEQIIPEDEGGFWIREIGLYDDEGVLIAVANCPETYKPQLQEGSGRTQTIRMILIVSSTTAVTLKIDPAVVLATRKYVDDKVIELKLYVDELMAAHLGAADPHTQYAPKASPTFSGTPKAPTPAAGNNTTQLATTAFVQAALVALINSAPATLDTLKEIAAAINNDPNFSTTINTALGLKAPLASPALTGTPTAPTAAQSANSTQIATTAFVKSAIAALVASSPAALDTLSELASALGNDPNFATTMVNALAGKQPLNDVLTSLSSLRGEANRLAYFNSEKGLALSPLTPVGRSVISQASVQDVLSFLGLGEAAKREVGTGANQLPDMNSFGAALTNPGWAKFPHGLIIQWGTTPQGATSRAINFPVPFPAAVFLVCHFDAGWSSLSNGSKWGATNKTQTGFNATTDTAGEGGNYIALGY